MSCHPGFKCYSEVIQTFLYQGSYSNCPIVSIEVLSQKYCTAQTVPFVLIICWHFSLSLQYVLKPTFTKQHIAGLDKQGKLYRAYDGTTYLPGIVGLNNIKANDYANVVLQVWITSKVWTWSGLGHEHLNNTTWQPIDIFLSLGIFQCSTFAKLLPGGGKLQGNPQATRGHHGPFGSEVWWADA